MLAIDGCVLACVRQTLARHGIVPSQHLELWRLGVRKRQHGDFSPAEAVEALAHGRAVASAAAAAAAAGAVTTRALTTSAGPASS